MEKINLWDLDPISAFKQFVVSEDFARTSRRPPATLGIKPISTESAKIYIFMFGNFAKWISNEKRQLSTITEHDIQRFIQRSEEGKPILNSRIASRYLRLLERCYDYLSVSPNPARLVLINSTGYALTRDAAGRSLSPEQLTRFLAALPSDVPRKRAITQFVGWKRRRDRAMQVVMALAGLRVSETIGLLVGEVGTQVGLDGSIEISLTPKEKHDTSYAHRATLPKAGVEELHPWLKERDQMQIPGVLVFPASIAGQKMTRKTVYKQTKATFARAGLDLSRSGGRTLRNTFARSKLESGTEADVLKDELGLALERSAAEYKFTRIKED